MRLPTVQDSVAATILLLLGAVLFGRAVVSLTNHDSVIVPLRSTDKFDFKLDEIEELAEVRWGWSLLSASTNRLNPFYTSFYNKPPPPPPQPAAPPPPSEPPKPKFRELKLTYRGCIVTSSGTKLGFVLLDGQRSLVVTNGTFIDSDLMVQQVDLEQVELVDPTGQTNIIPFRKEVTLKIPIK